jgi:hypothetical protein
MQALDLIKNMGGVHYLAVLKRRYSLAQVLPREKGQGIIALEFPVSSRPNCGHYTARRFNVMFVEQHN